MTTSVKHKQIFSVVLVALCTAILTSLELVLNFLPNIQVTFLLIVVFSKTLKTKKTLIIILLHVILDNLIIGSFNIYFVLTMLLGLSIIPITLNTIFKYVKNSLGLAVLGILYSFIYSWLYIIPSVLLLDTDFKTYLILDLPFEGLLAGSSFLSILWLEKPLCKVIDYLLVKKD